MKPTPARSLPAVFPAKTLARFWDKVDRSAEDRCWPWLSAKQQQGYGIFTVGTNNPHPAHRVAYQIAYGDLDPAMQVDHSCHNYGCVNPLHLRQVTRSENQQNRAGLSRNNTTGVRGVTRTRGGKFTARATHAGKHYQGGTFSTLAEAEAAVVALRNSLMTHNDMDRVA